MIVVGLSHRTAPISIRERLAIPDEELDATLMTLASMPEVSEVVLLSTCNRVEIYAEAQAEADDEALERRITAYVAKRAGRGVTPHLVAHHGSEAVKHLFRVASSLDSLVVGEPQILGQIKDAIRYAERVGTLGPTLDQAGRAALKVAKKVRTETAIGSGQVSVPSVAVDLAKRIFEELAGHHALLIGAGEMAESAAKLLARAGANVLVVNRSADRAAALATQVGGRPLPWSALDDSLVEADIVIASTAAAAPIVTKRQLKGIRRRRRGRSLFLIDIAVPRDVDPTVQDLDYVYLYDIDDLSHVVAESLQGRRGEAERAEKIVRRELRLYEERRTQLAMKPVIIALRERTRELLLSEVQRSCRGKLKHLSDDDRAALEKMVEAAVNKLLHAPTKNLKQLAGSTRSGDAAALIAQLFELERDLDDATPHADASTEQEGLSQEEGHPDDDHPGQPAAAR